MITKPLHNIVGFEPQRMESAVEVGQRRFAQGLVIQPTKLHQMEVLFR